MTEQLDKPKPAKLSPRDALAARHTAAAEKVADLRRKRVKAHLEGKTPDYDDLRKAEDDLAGLADALAEMDAEASRKAAEDAEDAAAKRYAAMKAEVRRIAKERLAGIEDAEAGCRAFVDGMRRADDARTKLQVLLHENFGTVPSDLMQQSQTDRLSRGLSAALRAYLGTYQFGDVKLRPGQRASDPHGSWVSAESGAELGILALLGPATDVTQADKQEIQ